MGTNGLCWETGGPQGSGVDSAARLFALAAGRGGLHVVGQREYYSNIKGRHSYYKIRVSPKPIRSPVDGVHMLATYDTEALVRHVWSDEVVSGGAIIYDPRLSDKPIEKLEFLDSPIKDAIVAKHGADVTADKLLAEAKKRGCVLMPLPYDDLQKTVGERTGVTEASKLGLLKNTLAVAASLGAMRYEREVLDDTLVSLFSGKKNAESIIRMNQVAAHAAMDHMQQQFPAFGFQLRRVAKTEDRIFLQGTDVVALAKMVAGCRFQTYYPISPATDESVFLEGHPDSGMAVVQTEDEIAAVTMAIGAALTGARASTSTSGPGFNLMVEGMGWAGMCEVPLVVVNYQRGGPSTGLPTRTAGGDALFAMHAGHDEFPRFVLSPGDLQEMFFDTIDAFNWAERYQTLVILLPDKNLAGNSMTTTPFDLTKVRIDRGRMATPDDLARFSHDGKFERYNHSENGVSARVLLGAKGGIHWLTGDEHDEHGHITEDPEIRDHMMEKRMQKMELADREIPAERRAALYGPKDADITLVSWGSTKGPILDALEILAARGIRADFLQLRVLLPFPGEHVRRILARGQKLVSVDANYTGQTADIVLGKTGVEIPHRVVKYNGRPYSCDEVAHAVEDILKNAPERVVARGGV